MMQHIFEESIKKSFEAVGKHVFRGSLITGPQDQVDCQGGSPFSIDVKRGKKLIRINGEREMC